MTTLLPRECRSRITSLSCGSDDALARLQKSSVAVVLHCALAETERIPCELLACSDHVVNPMRATSLLATGYSARLLWFGLSRCSRSKMISRFLPVLSFNISRVSFTSSSLAYCTGPPQSTADRSAGEGDELDQVCRTRHLSAGGLSHRLIRLRRR